MSENITPVTSPAIREPHYERVGLGALGASGGALVISNMAEAVSVAQLMAKSGIAIRKHLRDQPGACLGVLMQAMRWEFDPYMVANKSYAVNDQLAYEAQLLAAVVLTRAAIVDEPDYTYEGEGPTRTCTIAFKMRSGKILDYTTPQIGGIKTQNSPLWKSDPDQQLGYFAVRSWARRHQPHVLLGVYTVEEASEIIDITPGTSGVASRLPGAQAGNGFNREGVEAEGERAAPKAARATRKPKAPEKEEPDEPEEPMHAKTPEAVAEEAKEAAELMGLRPTETAGVQPAESRPDTQASAGLAPDVSQAQTDSSQPDTSTATSAGEPATTENVLEQEPIGDADLPPDLSALITAAETVETWDAVKAAMGTFQKTALWPTLSPDQQNHIRRSTWDTLADRNLSWLPDHDHDLSAFRLWVEAQDEPAAIKASLALLQADPAAQAKASALQSVSDAAAARIKDLAQ